MSKTFRARARARIDLAIGHSFIELSRRPFARLAFANLLVQVRTNSSLLRPTHDGSQQLLALEALRNMARHHEHYLRWPSTWAGGEASVYTLVHSLASHLFGRYPIPRLFGQVWFGGTSPEERTARRWFIEYASGRRFRDIPGLPMKMTRKMERILLHSPHHLPLRAAMRRAEILALGGEPALVDTILATSLAHDLEHGDFWREAMQFFIRYFDELGPEQVKSLVELFYAIRIRPTEIGTADGLTLTRPVDPNFSLAGRTPNSVLTLWAEGKQSFFLISGEGIQWPSAKLPGMFWHAADGEWRMFELLCSGALSFEGRAMHNCVGGYSPQCVSGDTSIWSLRRRNRQGAYVSRCTIHVRPSSKSIVQIRGRSNSRVVLHRSMIEEWAAQAGLTIPESAW